jgi:DNA-binding NtrC family response regulator
VRWAASFPDAARLLAAESYDLLITDVRLGAYNGLQLVARICLHYPATSTIVLTRFPDSVLAAEARRMGATYATSPHSPAELLSLVAKALAAVDQRSAAPGE